MDIKITGKRFKNLLSYEWVKMIALIVAGVVVWSLLFTTLGTRITVGENFTFFTYEGVYTVGSENKNETLLNEAKNKGYFSYDVLETNSSSIVSGGQYTATYMLSLKMTTQDGDVMIISDGRAVTEKEEGESVSDLGTIINSGYLCDIQTLLTKARDYCVYDHLFITENEDGTYTVNEDVIRKYFLEVRVKSAKNYKKTYRTAEQKENGAKLEINRIKKLYENYLYVSKAIAKAKSNDSDFLWYGEIYTYDSKGNVIKEKTEVRPFGIDLYKLNTPFIESGIPDIANTWYTYADGKTTAEGLVACVFDFTSYQPDLQYETLGFLRYLIETYSGY